MAQLSISMRDGSLANDALRRCEEKLEEVQRIAKLGYYSYDIVNDVNTRSVVLLEILGIDDDYATDIAGWLALIHPEDRTRMDEYLVNLLKNQESFDTKYRIIHGKSGQARWMHGLGQYRRKQNCQHDVAIYA